MMFYSPVLYFNFFFALWRKLFHFLFVFVVFFRGVGLYLLSLAA